MSMVDLFILGLTLLAAVDGWYRGAARQVLAFGGFVVGIYVGAAAAPWVAGLMEGPTLRTIASISTTIGMGSLFSYGGRELASHTMSRYASTGVSRADRVAGIGVSAGTTLLVVWLIASMLATAPVPALTSAIHSSRTISAMDSLLPPAPTVFSRVRGLIAAAGFPDVFAEFEPEPGAEVVIPDDPTVRAAVAKGQASTVKIVGQGCGGIQTGSGVVAAQGLVVTNAHVVAGIDAPKIVEGRSTRSATTVHFDPQMDVAILRLARHEGPVLPFATGPARQGQSGAALGYPGGGPFTASPAAVIDEIRAVGRDIYGRELTTRNVVRIRSDIRPGNSGGPLVTADGVVIGIVFSKSAFREGLGYALASRDVAAKVRSVSAGSPEVGTGPCAA